MASIKALSIILLYSSCILSKLGKQIDLLEEDNIGNQARNVQTNSMPLHTFKANNKTKIDIIKKYKRDMLFFTEGLSFISKNVLIESTGMKKQSEIHYLNLDDMSVSNSFSFNEDVFGEGSSMIKDQETGENVAFMMTWQSGIVYRMDEQLTRIIKEHQLPKQMKEGWGMTVLDKETILTTDGSNKIFHINPSDFSFKKSVEVFDEKKQPIINLNEIEIIDGKVYSNVWTTNKIVVIDPNTGELLEELDFGPLTKFLEEQEGYKGYTSGNNCLNGIAYNHETKQYLVTGKYWHYIYEIKINKVQQ